MSAPYTTDPNVWEIRDGLRVGDLATVEQCEEAARFLDMQTDKMMAQISRAEAGEEPRPPGWRGRVQAALRWTNRIRKAVNVRAAQLRAAPSRADQKRKALLAVIFDEVGEEAFARFAAITEVRHPELFKGGEHAG